VPSHVVDPAGIEALKWLEEAVDLAERDNRAAVDHREHRVAVYGIRGDLNASADDVVADGIVNEVSNIGFPIAEQYFGFDGHPSELYVRSIPSQDNAVAAVLPATVSPDDPSVVSVNFPSDILKAQVAAKGAYNGLLLGLGAVALLVGGVGIANVMAISVLERRSEIGLRRALGARRRHVAEQFLAEALILSVLGGVAGTVIGVATTAVYAVSQHWSVQIPVVALYGGG
jgi:putative ABC transport system permease protein